MFGFTKLLQQQVEHQPTVWYLSIKKLPISIEECKGLLWVSSVVQTKRIPQLFL